MGRIGGVVLSLLMLGCSARTLQTEDQVGLSASFTVKSGAVLANQTTSFIDTSLGNPTSWRWDFGDGSTSSLQNPTHIFTITGPTTVSLEISNNAATEAISQTMQVVAVLAMFSHKPFLPAPGRVVSFEDRTMGTPAAWFWEFGDGTTGDAKDSDKSYSASGVYPVSLRVTNSLGSDTAIDEITVSDSEILPADRVIDWTYTGIPGGIPERTVIRTTLQPGATAAQINTAIAAASGSGQVVYLKEGTYRLSEVLEIGAATDMTIRGAGAGKTIIDSEASGYSIASRPTSIFEAPVSGGTAIASGYTKGSRSMTLAATPPATFKVGNLVQIVQNDDYILVFHRKGNWAGNRNLRHTSRITAVRGKVIEFATPIPYSYHAAYSPQANAIPANARLVGIEDLTVKANGKLAITFGGADRCWVKGVETIGTMNSSIEFRGSSQCEVRRCYLHDAYGYPNQSDGYGVLLFYGTSYCRLEDNIGHRMANLVMLYGTSANTILYNYCKDTEMAGLKWVIPGINCNHGPHGIMNLFEGNIINRIQNDGYHGSTSHGVIFRNHINGLSQAYTEERRLVDLCRGSYYHSVIGNILGDSSWAPVYYEAPGISGVPSHTQGCIYILGYPNMGDTSLTPATEWENFTANYPDTKVADTLLRHGNYDYFNKATIWDPNIVSRNIPSSLVYPVRPEYFGSCQWPPIGPDVGGLVTDIPAKFRWQNYASSGLVLDLCR